MNMNLRDLHYIVLLAEYRHFGQAAEAANVSQPTLSAQVRKVEDELGVQLFERDNRNVVPTAAGLAVVAEAKNVLGHVDAIKDVAGVYKDPLAGELRIGVIASLSPYLVPELLERLGFDAPRMRVRVVEGLTDGLLEELQERSLDMVIMASDVKQEGLMETALFEEPFFMAHAPEHRFAGMKSVAISDVREEELLLLDEGHCLRDQALDVCKLDAGDPRVKATSLTTLMRLVMLNRGVTLLPALAAQQAVGVTVKPLQGQGAKRHVRLVTRKPFLRVGAQEVVVNAVRAVVRDAGVVI